MQKLWSLPGILLLVGLFFLVKNGRQNQTDPDWLRVKKMLHTDFVTLEKSVDSLRIMHEKFHGHRMGDDSTAFKIAAGPGLPTMTFSKFSRLFRQITEQQKVVLSAVSGSGLTTIGDRMARLVASDSAHILSINCAPQFDLEYHKKYIGDLVDGHWQPGELLRFWERAQQNPTEKFVILLDNLDKINPETLFGPEIWEKLTDNRAQVVFDKKQVLIPQNAWLISVTHLGEGAKIELSNEHFKRLGNQIVILPSAEELVISLKAKRAELEAELSKKKVLSEDDAEKLAALRDSNNLQRFVYFFEKTNQLLAEKLDASFQLGWTNFRKMYRPMDFEQARQQFINNANGLKPREPITENSFAAVDYALKTGGLLKDSNFFSRMIDWLRAMGFLTEFTMVSLTATATAIGGWWFFQKDKKGLDELHKGVTETMQSFDNQHITTEEAHRKLVLIKKDLHKKVAARKLNYTAGLYFLRQIDDEARRLEIAQQTNSTFLHLVETFMEDGILSDSEYRKLTHFLEAIRLKIPAAEWQRYRDEVESLYQKYKMGIA